MKMTHVMIVISGLRGDALTDFMRAAVK